MTQLARPDPARSRSGRDDVRPGQASATTEPLPAGLLRVGQPVPGWAIGTALLAPVALVGGWLIAGSLQPAAYSPMRQTMSVLAGHAGTDPWVMTAALLLVGSCQISTGAGLTAVRWPARIVLILTGISTLGIAASPEPATGPTWRHLAFAVSCVVTTALWPVLVARRAPARSRILGASGCATVTVIFAGLSCWLLIAAHDGGANLGLVERLTSAAQGLFPLVVALALRQTAQVANNQAPRGQERFQAPPAMTPPARRLRQQVQSSAPDGRQLTDVPAGSLASVSDTDGYDAAFARVDDVVARAVEQGQAPGVVAAVSRGEIVHVATAGVMAVGGAPMRRDTLFRISSTTKPMTAAAVLSLVDDGLLDLDGSVDELLPELTGRRVLLRPDGPLDQTVRAERSITVRDLLTFTWGFGMQGAMFMAPEPWPIVTAARERQLSTFGPPEPGAMPDPDTWMARLGELPLLAQPGERWLYQSGSQVLGVLAARAAGAPFDVVLRDRVFDPLGMKDTAFHTADTSRLSTAYESRDGLLVVSDQPEGHWSRPPLFPDGSGGLLSSVDDVVAFGRMLMRGGGPVLKPATVADMTRDQLTAEQRASVWPGFSFLDDRGWGFGLSVLDDGRYTWEGGLGTAWSNVPAQDLTVVVMTQRAADDTGMPAVCDEVLSAAALTA